MEQCSFNAVIGDKKAVASQEEDIKCYTIFEDSRPISMMKVKNFPLAVRRYNSNANREGRKITMVDMVKNNASRILSMIVRPDRMHLGLSDEIMGSALTQLKKSMCGLMYYKPENRQEMTTFEQFGFAPIAYNHLYIRNREVYTDSLFQKSCLGEEIEIEKESYVIAPIEEEEYVTVSHFVNDVLCKKYGAFVIRNFSFFEKMIDCLKDVDGTIFTVKKYGKLAGCYICENIHEQEFYRDLVFENENIKSELFTELEYGSVPTMARIVNLRSFVKNICSEGKVTVAVRLDDPMIRDNNGIFLWYLDENGSRMERVEDLSPYNERFSLPKPELSVTIGEFTSILLGYTIIQNKKFESIKNLGPVWFEE